MFWTLIATNSTAVFSLQQAVLLHAREFMVVNTRTTYRAINLWYQGKNCLEDVDKLWTSKSNWKKLYTNFNVTAKLIRTTGYPVKLILVC